MSTGAAATKAIAAFASSLAYEDIPPSTTAVVKRVILDSIGTALAATTLGDGCREVIAVLRKLGGAAESTILGVGAKIPAMHAAFVNGALVHALNYDPIGSEIGHVGVICLPAPLALAESIGGASGQDLIVAATVACEVSARITAAISRTGRRPSEKFLSGQLLGHFGAAAGAGRVLGLSPAAMESALGLAMMQMNGSRQIVLSGDPPAKAIYGAFPNQTGVLAALLADEGLGAQCDVFGEPAGLYAAIYGGQFDAKVLTEDLGESFLLEDAEFKPWPTSNQVHPFIEAALDIAGKVRPSDIADVEIRCHSRLRPWCEPLEKRRQPQNPTAAADSIPFCAASAVVHGDITLRTFTEEGIKDADTLYSSSRTTVTFDDAVNGAMVSVKANDGARFESRVDAPLGSRLRPISDSRLFEKFGDCCRRSITPLNDEQIERLAGQVLDLEKLEDIETLTSLACGKHR